MISLVVMRFMGDAPLKGTAEHEVVSSFLKVKKTQTHSFSVSEYFLFIFSLSLLIRVCPPPAHRRVYLDEG